MEQVIISLAVWGASLALFTVLYRTVLREQRQGKRLFLVRFRTMADSWLEAAVTYASSAAFTFTTYLRRPARKNKQSDADPVLASTLIRHATHTPLTVTYTDNHLSKIRQHKTEVSLTAEQRQQLREKKLSERF